MPLLTNNIVVTASQDGAVSADHPLADVASARVVAPPSPPQPGEHVQQIQPTHRNHTVIINGKEKTISKSSKYLLDMISK